MLTEDDIQNLLKIPGARRAAVGVLVPLPEGGAMHIQDVRKTIPGFSFEDHEFERICSVKEVIRLRHLRTPHDYLLRLRANALVEKPRLIRVIDRHRSSVEAKGRAWSLNQHYESLDRSAKRYIARTSRHHQKVIRPVPVGLAPIQAPNALCMRSLAGDVIVASESLRFFFYFMLIATQGGRYGFNRADQVDAAIIALRLMTGAEALDFDLDPRAVLDRKIEAEFQGQTDWLMEFTWGHEYGHLLLNHLGSEAPGLAGAELKAFAHDQEFAADLHAIRAVQDRNAGQDLAVAGFNIMLFLHFIDLVGEERSDAPRFSISSTHPGPMDRLTALRGALPDKGLPKRSDLDRCVREMRRLRDDVLTRIETSQRDDVLTFFGSIHLAGLGGKPLRDRLDF